MLTRNTFRGYDLEGKKWVYGQLLVSNKNKNSYIVLSFLEPNLNLEDFAVVAVRVDDKSVGQFSGLFDNNNKPIFEGDYVLQKVSAPNRKEDVFLCKYDKSNQFFGLYAEGFGFAETYEQSRRKIVGNNYENERKGG